MREIDSRIFNLHLNLIVFTLNAEQIRQWYKSYEYEDLQ